MHCCPTSTIIFQVFKKTYKCLKIQKFWRLSLNQIQNAVFTQLSYSNFNVCFLSNSTCFPYQTCFCWLVSVFLYFLLFRMYLLFCRYLQYSSLFWNRAKLLLKFVFFNFWFVFDFVLISKYTYLHQWVVEEVRRFCLF